MRPQHQHAPGSLDLGLDDSIERAALCDTVVPEDRPVACLERVHEPLDELLVFTRVADEEIAHATSQASRRILMAEPRRMKAPRELALAPLGAGRLCSEVGL